MNRRIAFIHASPAAVAPLTQFYRDAAPELEITNLLDDGLLRLFQSGDDAAAQARLAGMIRTARDGDGAGLALLTCSAVPSGVLARLRASAGIPLLKIDEPLCRAAVCAGPRIGVVVAFTPTLETTAALLQEAAAEAGTEIELLEELVPEAHHALLSGNTAEHDRLLLAAIDRLRARSPTAIVLAQVSMSRVLPQIDEDAAVPVLSSLSTSLAAVRQTLKQTEM